MQFLGIEGNFFEAAAQNVRSTRPQPMKTPEACPLGYVEDFSEVRTKLAGVFSSRLIARLEARRGFVEYRCGSAREGFVVCVVECVDAELDQAGRQQIEELF